ncbi:exosome nuclease subunit [Cladophialophora chaetospira]|uniref:Exosome nuclease subunit n=1 Tax=Cladophialophora chaetospira TaxID=386627 RepID=A0AA38XE55_9EURO|nr:exosome nuclease subunit [Cladophialophora chaetospira]
MDLTTDFKAFQDLVQASLINVTRSATQVSNQDLSFHRSSSDKLSRSLDRQNAHLLRLTNKLLKVATQDTQLKPPSLQDQDDIEDSWRGIVDVVDGLLEKADSSLDEFSGVIKPQSPPRNDTESPRPSNAFGVQRWAKDNAPRPQTTFERQVNNFDQSPWKPLLKTKPHATVSLEESIGTADTGYKHPYAQEIENYKYPPSVYQFEEPIPFTPIENSNAIYVDTEEGAKEMLQELKKAKEIAIDLEHNDLRSYVGLVCLMQISTRDKDWIIDTLKPWREKLQMLNEVFANPNVLKVLHGSNMDIIWLQRDLGLYIVGLFDTFHAASALQFPGKGLKHLLLQFANVHAQKQFQLSDWRIRPLPQELLDYARSDTHYLLTIYDHMRNMLIQGSSANINLTDYVLTQSKKEALQMYARHPYDLETGGGALGWFGLLTMRSTNTLSKEQLGVFRALHAWRDRKARELDEGVQYILPNRTLWLVAEHMPEKAITFHQTCRGEAKFVQNRIPEICEVVKQGKDEGKTGMSHVELLEHCEKALGVIARRPHKERKPPPQTTFSGLGDTLRQMAASRQVNTLNYDGAVDMEKPVALRCSASAFWGKVQPQHQVLPPNIVAATEALASILPLAQFTPQAEAVEEESKTITETRPPRAENAAKMMPLTAKDRLRSKATEIITLRTASTGQGTKRKVDAVDDNGEDGETASPPVANGSSALSTPTASSSQQMPDADITYEAARLSKKSRKAEKKARKAAERIAAEAAAQSTVPFDYANAPSLLTASGGGDEEKVDTGRGSKKLNHVAAKALDTTTGARRNKMGKELAGRSMTFKS